MGTIAKSQSTEMHYSSQEIGNTDSDENTVSSWRELPGGDYIDPDEEGTNWFRANNGEHWYQNSDETWTKWID